MTHAPNVSPAGLATVVLAHIAVLAALMSAQVVPVPAPLATLMVNLIEPAPPPPEVTPPKPREVVPPRPRPVTPKPRPRPEPPTPVLATEAALPMPAQEVVARLPEPQPLPPIQAPPPPVAAPAQAVVAPPRFDADYLDNPSPVYPALARRMHEEGRVVLRVHVEPNGRPSQIELKSSSGSPRLDQSARDAVARWKFVPARLGDTAVAAWVLVPIAFNLKE